MEPAEGLDKGCRGETSHTLETGEKSPKHNEQGCGLVLRTAKSKHTSLSQNKVTGDVFAFLALCADLSQGGGRLIGLVLDAGPLAHA